MSISPNDLLDIGTRVQVNGKRGIVVKAEMVRDYYGGFICRHTIEYREKMKRTSYGKYSWISIEPKQAACNYSFIEVLK
jgi:hypothetical protein